MPGAGRVWPGRVRAGVSLTYDGALQEHLSHVVPALASFDLRATFYPDPAHIVGAPLDWTKVAETGHEIGNHALFGLADRDGMLPDLEPDKALEDVAEFERTLEEWFPGAKRSFARPAVRGFSETLNPVVPPILRQSILRLNDQVCAGAVARFAAARSAEDGLNLPGETDARAVRSMLADGLDAEALGVLVELAMSRRAWLVLVFDGLRDSVFDPDAHDGLCRLLAERREVLEVAPLVEIAERFV